MVIQELKPSARVEGRWLAVLEDGSLLRLGQNEVADFALYPGRELTEEEGAALMAALRRNALREKALALLARKPQSRWELARKLKEWGGAAEEGEAICDRLEELGYLNDAVYAAQVVEHYSAKGFGTKRLRDELYRRGIPRELWEEALSQAGEATQAIDAFLRKKLKDEKPDRAALKRVSDALARRGYSWSDISRALSRYQSDPEWTDDT